MLLIVPKNSKFIMQKFLTKFKYVNLVFKFNLLKLRVLFQTFCKLVRFHTLFLIYLCNLVAMIMNKFPPRMLSFIKNCANNLKFVKCITKEPLIR